jgi:hypothetical protein
MDQREIHVMSAELIEERRTMRYTCPICQRCLEDGPDGITIIHRGDRSAAHRAGRMVPNQVELEQEPDRGPPALH